MLFTHVNPAELIMKTRNEHVLVALNSNLFFIFLSCKNGRFMAQNGLVVVNSNNSERIFV